VVYILNIASDETFPIPGRIGLKVGYFRDLSRTRAIRKFEAVPTNMSSSVAV
jgi:hypothetical protein